jgi:hypothetical protein
MTANVKNQIVSPHKARVEPIHAAMTRKIAMVDPERATYGGNLLQGREQGSDPVRSVGRGACVVDKRRQVETR